MFAKFQFIFIKKKIDPNFQTILNYIPTKEPPPTYHKTIVLVNDILLTPNCQMGSTPNGYGLPEYIFSVAFESGFK